MLTKEGKDRILLAAVIDVQMLLVVVLVVTGLVTVVSR
jgi:hypothetical protein